MWSLSQRFASNAIGTSIPSPMALTIYKDPISSTVTTNTASHQLPEPLYATLCRAWLDFRQGTLSGKLLLFDTDHESAAVRPNADAISGFLIGMAPTRNTRFFNFIKRKPGSTVATVQSHEPDLLKQQCGQQ